MMQGDVKAAYTAVDAALVATSTRIKGIHVAVTTAGANPVILYDNASAASGTVLATIGANAAGHASILLPGSGIKAQNGVYCDTGSAASVTVFYG